MFRKILLLIIFILSVSTIACNGPSGYGDYASNDTTNVTGDDPITDPDPIILSDNADLLDIEISPVDMHQTFSSETVVYTAKAGISTESVAVVPYVDSTATVTINGVDTISGTSEDVTMNLGDNTITVVVTAEDSTEKTYTFTVTRELTAQQAYIKASNTGAGDFFGRSVAISGDTLVIGAPNESSNSTGINGVQSDNNAPNSGAAYVFTRTGSTWTQQAYLKASNTNANDNFGFSVSISGNTIVVGAYGEDSNSTGVNGEQSNNSFSGSGAAYVFVRSGTTWTQQAYLKASNTNANDMFGYNVSISGETIVVGSRFEQSNATGVNGNQLDNSASTSGAAYVYARSGTTWTQQAYLKASNTNANDMFGESVSIDENTIVVGSRAESSNATGVNGNQLDNSASTSGAAYVYVRSGTTWTQQAYLKASNTNANDRFGYNVSISGKTIVVGAYGESSNETGVNGDETNNSASNSGAAYVFTRTGTTWTQQAYLKASNTNANDMFGVTVDISGNILIVGSHREESNATGIDGDQSDNSASGSGAIYVFVRNGTTWTYKYYLKSSNSEGSDYLGDYRIAISENTIVTCAIGEDSNATEINGDETDNSASDSGAAYIFY